MTKSGQTGRAAAEQRPQAAIRVSAAGAGVERIADVPIYHADPIVRRADSLQLTAAARRAMQVGLPTALFESRASSPAIRCA